MSRHLIDQEILPLLDMVPPMKFDDESIIGIREMLATAAEAVPEPHLRPELRHARAKDRSESVPVLIFDPPERRNRAAILQIHGGGMVLGTASWSNLGNAALASDLDVLVVSVDYRLAPENPFPAPHMDCLTAYEWLISKCETLNVEPGRIAICGESAGGGLAASTVHMARDLGLPIPRLQVLTYPMLDYRTGTPEKPGLPNTGEHIFTREMNTYCWRALRGKYSCDDGRKGWFSPAIAQDLSKLSPAFLATGALDLFLDENLDYSRRLAAAGVQVELHVYPGAIHAFDQVPNAAVARRYERDKRAAISRALDLTSEATSPV